MGADLEFIIDHSLEYKDLLELPARLNEYFAKIEFNNTYIGGPHSQHGAMLGWKWREWIEFDADKYQSLSEWCSYEWMGLESDYGPTLYFGPHCFLGSTGHEWDFITSNPIWNINMRKTIELLGRFFGSSRAIIFHDSLSMRPDPEDMVFDSATLNIIEAQMIKQNGPPSITLADAYHEKWPILRATGRLDGWYLDYWNNLNEYYHLYCLHIALQQAIQGWAEQRFSENFSDEQLTQMKDNAERFTEIKTKLQKLNHGLSKFQMSLLDEFEVVLQNREAGPSLHEIRKDKSYIPNLDINSPIGAAECLVEAFASDLYRVGKFDADDPMIDIN